MPDGLNENRLPSTPKDRTRFGDLLRGALGLAEMTQEQLAADLPVVPSAVSQWVHGKRWIQLVALLHVLRAVEPGRVPAAIRLLVDAVWGPIPGRWATEEGGIELHVAIPAGAVNLGHVAEILSDGQVDASEAPRLRELARRYREHAAAFEAAADRAEGRTP